MHATFYGNSGVIGDATHLSWAQLHDPFGGFDDGTKAVVAACGYNSGRGVSGVDDRKVFAETIPPADPYATRTPPNPKQGTTLATIEGYVTAAEQHGGGWVQLAFHHVCDGCDAYSISAANLSALLDWLQPRGATGTVVETTNEVVGGGDDRWRDSLGLQRFMFCFAYPQVEPVPCRQHRSCRRCFEFSSETMGGGTSS